MAFRYKRGIDVGFLQQMYIYSASLNYKNLTKAQQKKILKLCKRVGGANSDALFDFVTTDISSTAVCLKYNIASRTTLYRLLKDYYENFPMKF